MRFSCRTQLSRKISKKSWWGLKLLSKIARKTNLYGIFYAEWARDKDEEKFLSESQQRSERSFAETTKIRRRLQEYCQGKGHKTSEAHRQKSQLRWGWGTCQRSWCCCQDAAEKDLWWSQHPDKKHSEWHSRQIAGHPKALSLSEPVCSPFQRTLSLSVRTRLKTGQYRGKRCPMQRLHNKSWEEASEGKKAYVM